MPRKAMPIKRRDVELLFEMGSLRFVQRTWKRFLNPDFQNLVEHHYRVIWLALVIASYEGVKNTDKIMKMALIHDIAESRTGDADYLSRQYVQRNEDLGMSDVLKDTNLEKEFLALWEEYEEKKSIESQIVKDADNLDVDLEILEQSSRGNKLIDSWRKDRKFIADERLYTKTAKMLWKALQTANPHDWHLKGRNRFRGGDWKR